MKRNIRSITASALTKLVAPLLLLTISCLAVGEKTAFSQGKCKLGEFEVSYYRNQYLKGAPAATKCGEKVINHYWAANDGPTFGGDGKSDGGEKLSDHFSARWEGRFQFQGGNYTFHAKADDGVRLWVDDRILIDQWNIQGAKEFSKSIQLSRAAHGIRVDYFENDGPAVVHIWWDPPQ
jgi:hypothetical protein